MDAFELLRVAKNSLVITQIRPKHSLSLNLSHINHTNIFRMHIAHVQYDGRRFDITLKDGSSITGLISSLPRKTTIHLVRKSERSEIYKAVENMDRKTNKDSMTKKTNKG
jgi:hypothetical protein